MQNPFTLTFGRSPLESVDRPVQINEIIENFTADTINQQMFIITGVRGSGKTVMMTEISHKLRENDDWVVIELNPATDLLSAMLSKLNSDNICAGLIKSAKLDRFWSIYRGDTADYRCRDSYYKDFGKA